MVRGLVMCGAVVGCVACFNPTFNEGIPCGPGGQCPGDQRCGADDKCYDDVTDASAAVADAHGTDASPVDVEIDASGRVTSQYLDETCQGEGTDCGGLTGTGEYICLVTGQETETMGFCSHYCTTTADCTNDYDGPGMPDCAVELQGGETACAIVCASQEDCPETMVCGAPEVGVCLGP